MTKKLFFVMTILLVASCALMAADVSGKWTYEAPGRGGNPGRPTTITLKADGATLTGTVPGGGHAMLTITAQAGDVLAGDQTVTATLLPRPSKSPMARWMATKSPSP